MFGLDFTEQGDKEKHERAFNEGVKDGGNGGFFGDMLEDLGETATVIVPKSTEHQSYRAGYEEGVRRRRL